jgi:hypothetical protein
MAIGQTVEIEVDGSEEPVQVPYNAIDLRRWEDKFKKSVIAEPMSLTMLTYLAWSAATRTGAVDGALKDWKHFNEVCTSVRIVPTNELAEGDASGPTQTAPSDE